MKPPSLSVILPTYNERDNIVPLIITLLKHMPADTEILVVDDNSPDGTAGCVRRFQKTHRNVKLLVRLKDRGLTNSLNEGISKTAGDVIVWMDCDFSHPPDVIPKLLDKIDGGADIAIATRFRDTTKKNRENLTQTRLTSFLNTVLSLSFGSGITDYTTGFLAARRTVLKAIPLRGDYGEYCIDLLVRAQAKGFCITEVPFVSPNRRFGQSKTSPDLKTLIRHGKGYIMTFVRLIRTVKLGIT